MGERPEPWSAAEVTATVASYFGMLQSELAGQPYVKSAARRALLPLLNNRTESAVEFKYQNISAVLMESGLRPIQGYKPAVNYQGSLAGEVALQVNDNSVLEAMIQAANRQAMPGPVDLSLEPGSAPAVVLPDRRPGPGRAGFPDYAGVEARNRSLGLAGECAVVELEHRRLHALGKSPLAERIEHVSQTQGDGLGYDVLSFEPSGKERLIEVKTTRARIETPFYVSRNELAVSNEHSELYHLVRLFDFDQRPGWYQLDGSLSQSCTLEAQSYLAVPA